jgi:hypothetical protein
VKRDRRGRFVKTAKKKRRHAVASRTTTKRRRARNPAAPALPLKVAFAADGIPLAAFRSLPRARQYAQYLADHAHRKVRLFNPSKPSSRSGLGSSGKFYVVAALKRERRGKPRGPAYMGFYDDALETDRKQAVGFSTKAVAHSEAKRMAKLWPAYVWGVERK